MSCEISSFLKSQDTLKIKSVKKSVDSLIAVTDKNFDLVAKFYERKREILGLKKAL